MSGVWVQTSDGRYVYDNADGWYFDHLDQHWYYADVPASIPTGAPAAAARKRFWHRLTQRPQGIFMAGADAFRDDWLWGSVACLMTWLARLALVYSGYQIVKAWTVGGDGGWFLTRWVLGPPAADSTMTQTDSAIVYTFCYVFLAGFSFLVLLMAALNPEQSAALTTAFVAHRMYRHMVEDMSGANRPATWADYHPPPGRQDRPGLPW